MKQTYRLSNPHSPSLMLTRNAHRVLELTRRDAIDCYRGSFARLRWSLFNLLFMLAIHTFIFGVIFKSRRGQQTSSTIEFSTPLFSDCANGAPGLIIDNTNFVKRVVFPLGTLTWSLVGSVLFHVQQVSVASGSRVIIGFRFHVPIFLLGGYSVDVAIATATHTQPHRMHDVLVFKAIQSSMRHGLVGIPMQSASYEVLESMS